MNAGPDDVEVPVRLLLRGEPAGVRTVRVPGASAGSPGAPPAPGEVATTFELRSLEGATVLVDGELVVVGDGELDVEAADVGPVVVVDPVIDPARGRGGGRRGD